MTSPKEIELITSAQESIPFITKRFEEMIPKDHLTKAVECLEKLKDSNYKPMEPKGSREKDV